MILKPKLFIIVLLCRFPGFAQLPDPRIDSTINNLLLPEGYVTSEYAEIPEYIKAGKGKQKMILIPGLGFDASVFNDFMEANKSNYTMFAITIPGYGKTKAPPLPAEGTSYGEQNWNKGVLQGIVNLMEKEKIQKVIIAGHSTQGTQLALRMAIDHPDRISHVIILGGHAKFIAVIQGKPKEFSLDTMILYTDKYTAPQWFKHIRKQYFDDNNYSPSIYSLDSARGTGLWKQVAAVPLPVMVHYLCEFFASDIKTEFHKIKCPVLVLRALFNDAILKNAINNYVRYQFIDAWNDVSEKNSLIQVKDIPGAGIFVWKDKPKKTYFAVKSFLK
jgi:pimeloyl-ACP methyl ester carboxylesterase